MKTVFSSIGLFFKGFFNAVVYEPLFNLLALFVVIIPGNNLGVAVVLVTLVAKLVLAPFSYSALVAQVKNKKIAPFVEKVKKQYPDNKQLQAQKQLEIYKTMKVNPFSGCLPTLFQFFILIGLYTLFNGNPFADATHLYSFMSMPETVNNHFLWISNIAEPSVVLAVIAGLSQYLQIRLSPVFKKDETKEVEASSSVPALPNMQDQMQKMMKYGLPLMIFFFGLSFPSALTLYWIVNSLFAIGQEMMVRSKLVSIEQEIDMGLKNLSV